LKVSNNSIKFQCNRLVLFFHSRGFVQSPKLLAIYRRPISKASFNLQASNFQSFLQFRGVQSPKLLAIYRCPISKASCNLQASNLQSFFLESSNLQSFFLESSNLHSFFLESSNLQRFRNLESSNLQSSPNLESSILQSFLQFRVSPRFLAVFSRDSPIFKASCKGSHSNFGGMLFFTF